MPAPTVFSVKQPWAGLLVAGVKRFEVRSWYPVELGWYLVHASSATAPGLRELARAASYRWALRQADMQDPKRWLTSAVVGAVRISRIWKPDSPRPKLKKLDRILCGDTDGLVLWQVSHSVQFQQPIACKGRLNLWTLDGPALKAYELLFESGKL